jgi:hypothetical protein
MLEIVLVLGSLVALGVLAALTNVVTPQLMTEIGLWTLLLGLVTGLPTGLWYHIALYRTLRRRITMPRRWWLSPTDFHSHLAQDELAQIRRWFRLGAVGFVLSLGGGLAAMAGLLLAGR